MITAVKVAVQARSEGFLVLTSSGSPLPVANIMLGLAKTARHLQVLPRG